MLGVIFMASIFATERIYLNVQQSQKRAGWNISLQGGGQMRIDAEHKLSSIKNFNHIGRLYQLASFVLNITIPHKAEVLLRLLGNLPRHEVSSYMLQLLVVCANEGDFNSRSTLNHWFSKERALLSAANSQIKQLLLTTNNIVPPLSTHWDKGDIKVTEARLSLDKSPDVCKFLKTYGAQLSKPWGWRKGYTESSGESACDIFQNKIPPLLTIYLLYGAQEDIYQFIQKLNQYDTLSAFVEHLREQKCDSTMPTVANDNKDAMATDRLLEDRDSSSEDSVEPGVETQVQKTQNPCRKRNGFDKKQVVS